MSGHFSNYSIWTTPEGNPSRKTILILGPPGTLVMRQHMRGIQHATVRYENAEAGAQLIYERPETTVEEWWNATFHYNNVNPPETFHPRVYDITRRMINYPLSVADVIQAAVPLADVSSIFIPFQRADPSGSVMPEEGAAIEKLQEFEREKEGLELALSAAEDTVRVYEGLMPTHPELADRLRRASVRAENAKVMSKLQKNSMDNYKRLVGNIKDAEASTEMRPKHPGEEVARLERDGEGTYVCRVTQQTDLAQVRLTVDQMAIRLDLANFMIDNIGWMLKLNASLPEYDVATKVFYIANDTLRIRATESDPVGDQITFLKTRLSANELEDWALTGYRAFLQIDPDLKSEDIEIVREGFKELDDRFQDAYLILGGLPISNGAWWKNGTRWRPEQGTYAADIIFQLLTACGRLSENFSNMIRDGTRESNIDLFRGARSDNIVRIQADEGGDAGMLSTVFEKRAASAVSCFRYILSRPEMLGFDPRVRGFDPEVPATWYPYMTNIGFNTSFVDFDVVISSGQCRGRPEVDGGSSPVPSTGSIEAEDIALGPTDQSVLGDLARENHIFLPRVHGCRYSGYTTPQILKHHELVRRQASITGARDGPPYFSAEEPLNSSAAVLLNSSADSPDDQSIGRLGGTSPPPPSTRSRGGKDSSRGIRKPTPKRSPPGMIGKGKGIGKGGRKGGGRAWGSSPRRKSLRRSRRRSMRKSRRMSSRKSRRSMRKSRRRSLRKSKRRSRRRSMRKSRRRSRRIIKS